MILPFSWLKDYVDADVTPEELQAKLFSCGFEVEELTYLGKDVTNVVTGRITKTEKHPDADRLTVCQVDCGEKGARQIVTAATNVFEGAIVPVALDNSTVLHEGGVQKIKTGKLRGVTSEGMFCSGEELGITDDFYEGAEVNGILILDEDTPLGADIRPVVGIDDWLFDIAVTANRPDCQCVFGMAREVAAILQKPLKAPATDYTARPTDVKIRPLPALCGQLCGGREGGHLAPLAAPPPCAVRPQVGVRYRGYHQLRAFRAGAAHARLRQELSRGGRRHRAPRRAGREDRHARRKAVHPHARQPAHLRQEKGRGARRHHGRAQFGDQGGHARGVLRGGEIRPRQREKDFPRAGAALGLLRPL